MDGLETAPAPEAVIFGENITSAWGNVLLDGTLTGGAVLKEIPTSSTLEIPSHSWKRAGILPSAVEWIAYTVDTVETRVIQSISPKYAKEYKLNKIILASIDFSYVNKIDTVFDTTGLLGCQPSPTFPVRGVLCVDRETGTARSRRPLTDPRHGPLVRDAPRARAIAPTLKSAHRQVANRSLARAGAHISCNCSPGGHTGNEEAGSRRDGRDVKTGQGFKRVAVVEDFFSIIYNMHVSAPEGDGRPPKHAGQKRTYRAVSSL
ncbi:TFIIH complex serine/threonine-protein kinase subunit kin28 [Branchiostoma belcheri]|nr:TFIIH complex serine/threonine-protein kinase subunit kin28 [Branchiostoma belcheri]